MTDPIYLSDAALEGLGISPVAVTEAVERAVADKARGHLWAAPKAAIMPGDGRYTMATLSTGDDPALTVVKAVTSNPENAGLGLPAINGAILVLDSRSGILKATLGANWITAIRTAAISAAAARKLANPKARSIAFIGCGVQARIHLDTLAALFPIAEIRAVGRGQANVDTLMTKADTMGLAARRDASPEAAIEGADIVVTSVTLDYTIEPFLDAAWIKPGGFAAIVDLSIPWRQETMAAFGTLAIDDHEQEAASEKKLVPQGAAHADLGELVLGPHRFDPAKSAAFAFRGMALGDFAAAALVAGRALEAP